MARTDAVATVTLPDEPPVLLAWGPKQLAEHVAAALADAGWRPPERIRWATGCAYVKAPHWHVGGRCEGPDTLSATARKQT